jgi:hypothetical protein
VDSNAAFAINRIHFLSNVRDSRFSLYQFNLPAISFFFAACMYSSSVFHSHLNVTFMLSAFISEFSFSDFSM